MPAPSRIQERFGAVTYRQATLVSGLVSIIFALMVFAHEVALEGGFNLRNYVVLAFCCVWMIVTVLLILGACKRAHFLLLPWMILICMLTPLFIVGIVAGCKMISTCMKHNIAEACAHELHIFGTTEHTVASAKLGMLILMLIINSGSILVVYKFFMVLSGKEQSTMTQDEEIPSQKEGNVRYERFKDDCDPESNIPLCDNTDDTKETVT